MTQNFDLNKMGLAPMTGEEMQEIDGGKFPWYEIGAIAFGIAAIVCTPDRYHWCVGKIYLHKYFGR